MLLLCYFVECVTEWNIFVREIYYIYGVWKNDDNNDICTCIPTYIGRKSNFALDGSLLRYTSSAVVVQAFTSVF